MLIALCMVYVMIRHLGTVAKTVLTMGSVLENEAYVLFRVFAETVGGCVLLRRCQA